MFSPLKILTPTMGVEESVAALNQADTAIGEIAKQLRPFVTQLSDDDPEKKAQAQAVVALTIGTLRYMGARLHGKDEGRRPDDPLRQELDQMRKILVALEKKRKRKRTDDEDKKDEDTGKSLDGKQSREEQKDNDKKYDGKKKRKASKGKVIDKSASDRMVKSALGLPKRGNNSLMEGEDATPPKRKKRRKTQ